MSESKTPGSFWKSEAIIIGGIGAYAYLLAAIYQVAVCTAYGLPLWHVEPVLAQPKIIAAVAVIMLLAGCIAMFIRWSHIDLFTNRPAWLVALIAGVVFGVMVAVTLRSANHGALVGATIAAVTWIHVKWILPHLNKHNDDETIRIRGPIALAVLPMLFSYMIGAYVIPCQTVYWVMPDGEAIVYWAGDSVVTMPLDSSNRTLGPAHTVRSRESIYDIKMVPRAVGPLRVIR